MPHGSVCFPTSVLWPHTKAAAVHRKKGEQKLATSRKGGKLDMTPFGTDLEAQDVTELPDRDALSLVNLNAAVPINLAAALNVLSDGSAAVAGAAQNTPINQGMMGGTALPTGTG
jgi:hypothetical protein